MPKSQSQVFRVRAHGPLACFTRPEMKVERVSYEVMTPSAARGILEAILWKPAIQWRIHSIAVLRPVAWISFRRNELSKCQSPRITDYFAEDYRAQRNTVALRDVDYVISASFTMSAKAGSGDNILKFEEMFQRRLAAGQHHHMPCFGCREFAAYVEPAPETYQPIQPGVSRPLGHMLHDLDFDGGTVRARFFDARLVDGVVHVPPWSSQPGAAP